MSLQDFLFKRIDQLIVFTVITIFFILIMYFEKTEDEKEIDKYINTAFINICDIQGLKSTSTMGGFHNMYCNSIMDESVFAELVLTYKLLYTSSYNFNINIIDSISSVLNNKENNSASTHKLLLIIIYTIIYFSLGLITQVNGFIIKLFKIKSSYLPKATKKSSKDSLGVAITKSLKNRLFAFVFYILTFSILLNIFTYISDILMGMAQPSKLRGIFFVQMILLAFILLFTGIFNFKSTTSSGRTTLSSGSTTSTVCQNNNKYLILIFFLLIPIITGIKQLTTIIFRGIKGMYNGKQSPQLKILFNTMFIMVLVLFNIDLLSNIGKKPTNPLKL
jgi:hypothetical protein